jgi:hypothetical protein
MAEPISYSSDVPSMGSDQEPLKHPNQNLIGLLSNLAMQELEIRLEIPPILNQYEKLQLECYHLKGPESLIHCRINFLEGN